VSPNLAKRSKAFDAVWDQITTHLRLASTASQSADEREVAKLLLPRLQNQRARLCKNILRAK
jgi:hypothetical protein